VDLILGSLKLLHCNCAHISVWPVLVSKKKVPELNKFGTIMEGYRSAKSRPLVLKHIKTGKFPECHPGAFWLKKALCIASFAQRNCSAVRHILVHSFILSIYIAPLQEIYSEALPAQPELKKI